MKIHIPYGHQWIEEDDIDAVIKILQGDWITQGPEIERFEKAVAQYCGAKYAVAVCNGTAALHLAYLAAGLKKGDEVITTPNTFVATTNMLLLMGVKPVFCDIRLDTYSIDESKIEKLITKRTKAIVPVHFAGHPCEMREILRIARKYNLIVIEDGAHALGAQYKKKKIGSISDMTMFSFFPVKPITTGEGGVIVTNKKAYYDKMVLLRSHGVRKDKKGKNVMTELGYNYRMTDIQAALGRSQLRKIHKFLRKRHEVVRWYEAELRNLKNIILPVELPDAYSSWHLYVVRLANPQKRDGLAAHLKKQGIGANFHYPAVYSHSYYQKAGYGAVRLKNEEIYQKSCITLPCYSQLRKSDMRYVVQAVKDFFK